MTLDMENQNNLNEQPEDEQSFAELFESYQAGMSEDLQVGDKVSGPIIAMDDAAVFVDTGTKIDGVVEKQELIDDSGDFPYAVGDLLDLYVVAKDESEIRLSRAISGIGGLNMLRDAFKGGIPVEGKVKAVRKGGFQVEVLQRNAFCPLSLMDIKYIEAPETYVGHTFPFLIKRFEENGRNIVLSRREKLEQEQKEAQAAYLKDLTVDSIVEGRITRLMPYGAFVELTPGLEGMVHISELSWSRIQEPKEAVQSGDMIRVKVLRIEKGKKEGELKIGLSAKQTSADPWETVAETVLIGQRLQGKVTRCADFGAFVEILPGVEGLVHVSEISYVKRIHKPGDVLSPGDMVWVMVKQVDPESRKISLSIRDAEGDPWADITQKYTLGQVVSGSFEKKANFGFFVNLEPGVTGLLPKAKVARSSAAGALDKLKPGDPLRVTIDEIKPQARRISLGIADTKDEADWSAYAKDSAAGMGSLGEIFKAALEEKEED